MARFLPSGAPDPTFGRHGVAGVETLRGAAPLRLATEPNGAVVVAAAGLAAGESTPRVLLGRISEMGVPDHAFGRRGVIQASTAFGDRLDGLGVGPNHAIVLVKTNSRASKGSQAQELLVARYTHAGPDRLFGAASLARTARPAGHGVLTVRAVAFEPSGNAVVVGERRGRGIDVRRGTWFIARYGRQGLDCLFGSHGWVEGQEGGAYSVAIAQDHIVLAGWGPGHLPDGAGTAFMAARYLGGSIATPCLVQRPARRP